MLGIRYMKASPTTYVLQYRKGQVKRAGAGLSFVFYSPTSVIAHVPMSSTDVPFVFNEVTADFQDATIQGELTYRIVDAKRIAGLLDYSVEPSGADLVAGLVEEGQELIVESRMPAGGVIFSDGIESDFLQFTSGAIARIGVARQRARLVVG